MSWPLHKLEDLTEPTRPITYGVVKPGPEDPDNGVKFIRGGDIFEGRLAIDSLRTITPEVSNSYSRTLLSGGELVVSLVGNPGHVAVVPKSLAGANLARQAGLVALREEIDADFIKFFLMSPQGRAELFAQMTGSVQVVINLHNLRTVRVPLPPLPIQRRIAGILSAYDELIENSQRRIKILESMARALYREWFVHFRFPGHESIPRVPSPLGEMPQGWEATSLGDLCELRKDPYRDTEHSALPLLDMARMPSRSLAPGETGSPAELTTSRILFQAGDTLFGAIRCYLHKVVAAHYPGVTNTSVLVLRPRSPSFRALVAIIASDIDTIRWAETQSTGTKMPVINWGVFQGMPLPIPSEETAQAFEDIAGPILDEIGALATQIQVLRRTRDLLLPRLISGDIDLEASAA